MIEDDVLTELYRHRDAISAEADHDVAKLIARLKQASAERAEGAAGAMAKAAGKPRRPRTRAPSHA